MIENICETEDSSSFKLKLNHTFKKQVDHKNQSQRHVWFIHCLLGSACVGLL